MRAYRKEDFVGSTPRLECAIVVPVLNEVENIECLLERLASILSGLDHEIIFVDDGSIDGTAELVEKLAVDNRNIRLIRRIRRRGLASAVIEGFLSTVAPIVAVIDGDLQHDETILPTLIAKVGAGKADLAVGTRYADGGSVGGWSAERIKISQLATRMAIGVMKTPLSDPMSGYFAIRRDVILRIAPNLSQTGYKILLDIVATHPEPLAVDEVPFEFRNRLAGQSKLDGAVILEYLELLIAKLLGHLLPVKLIIFGAIGLIGTTVHLGFLAASMMAFSLEFALAQGLATLGAMTFNYTLNNSLTYRDRKRTGIRWLTGWLSFCAACSIGAIANIGIGTMLFFDTQSWWISGLAGALIGSVWNYAATSWFTWRGR